jgi:nicotinamide/nicotinate riboside kinase
MNRLLLIEPEVKEKKMDMLDIVEVCSEKIASYSTQVSDEVQDIDSLV